MDSPPTEQRTEEPQRGGRQRLVRLLVLAGWSVVLAVQAVSTLNDPNTTNLVALGGFSVLFILVNLQLLLMSWTGRRSWRRVTNRLHGSAYLSDSYDLPNRNYVLAELRREMPRARTTNSPFVLLQISLDTLDEVRERRGDDFADRTMAALVDTLKRLTRSSDFLAHMGEARFCVMLVECTLEQSGIYLQRVPGTISVSDGRQMFDVPVAARIQQYDMEAIYATDVLRDVEEMPALRRRETPRANAYAA
ncbi:MAG: diguanylate cyclase [Anaerolineaceae bacterium]